MSFWNKQPKARVVRRKIPQQPKKQTIEVPGTEKMSGPVKAVKKVQSRNERLKQMLEEI